MRFTVLGSSGFVGGHLAATLLREGHDVLKPGRADLGSLSGPLGHVIYTIGLTADFRTRPFDTVDAHVALLNALLRDADFESFTYTSSTRVYIGGIEGLETSRVSVSSLDPSDLYNLTKLTGESICFHCGRPNVRAVRLSNVIGTDTASSNFVFDIARDALRGHVQLKTDPASAKDYIGIDDVSALLTKIAVSGREKLYNLASGRKTMHREWLEALARMTGCTYAADAGAPVVGFPDVDIGRIQNEFGFEPRDVIAYLPAILTALKSSGA
jgi:nucleoside-diphosphate-sugar epimerase